MKAYIFILILATGCKANQKQTQSKQEMENTTQSIESQLHDIWALEKINNEAIELLANGKRPSLEIFVRDKRINGNAGCNNYFGTITSLDQGTIRFGAIGSTKMACPQMELEGKFFSILNDVHSFKREKLQLHLFTENNRSLQFRKID